MTNTAIRPQVLRQYHEASYGKGEPNEQAFVQATFDEYFQLTRILYPAISRRRAAENSEREDFRKLVDDLPPEPPEPNRPQVLGLGPGMFERKPTLDLSAVGLAGDLQFLTLSRIKDVTGWKALSKLARLQDVFVVLSGSSETTPLDPPIQVEKLTVRSCEPACSEVVVRSISARDLTLEQSKASPLGLGLFQGQHRVEKLWLEAPSIQGLWHLEPLPLKELHLAGGVAPGHGLRSLLDAHAKNLVRLGLTLNAPFGPSVLPELPALRRLWVSGYPEHREAWIDWAVAHPEVACRFSPYEPPSKGPGVELAEVYRDVDILRTGKGKQVTFEIAANLVDDILDTDTLDNGELEDRLRALAKEAGRKVQWDSESDTFVARAKDVETCRWLIDSVHAMKGGRAKKKG